MNVSLSVIDEPYEILSDNSVKFNSEEGPKNFASSNKSEKDENDNKEATTTKCGKNSTVIQLSYFVPQICFFPLA